MIAIRLPWGEVTWTADTITGIDLDDVSFRIEGVPLEDLERWLRGVAIQVALPTVSPDDREVLITGINPQRHPELYEEPIENLIERSSVGQALANIRERGIDAELADLDADLDALPVEFGGRRQP